MANNQPITAPTLILPLRGRKKPHILFLILLLTTLSFLPLPAQAVHRLQIIVSFSVIADMAKTVAGDAADVDMLVAPGGDVHVYEPTPADARKVANADLILVNGLGFEGWLDRLLTSTDAQGKVITVTSGIKPFMLDDNLPDPHAWQDIHKGMIYVANIRDALSAADPIHAKLYRKNTDHYMAELKELDTWAKQQVETVPEANRRAITGHDALHYFARAYGINLISIQGVSTEGDISAKTMASIIDQVRANHVNAVFLENMANPRLGEQLAKDSGAVIGGILYSDSLSDASGDGATYISMFRHNVSTITMALRK